MLQTFQASSIKFSSEPEDTSAGEAGGNARFQLKRGSRPASMIEIPENESESLSERNAKLFQKSMQNFAGRNN